MKQNKKLIKEAKSYLKQQDSAYEKDDSYSAGMYNGMAFMYYTLLKRKEPRYKYYNEKKKRWEREKK